LYQNIQCIKYNISANRVQHNGNPALSSKQKGFPKCKNSQLSVKLTQWIKNFREISVDKY